MVSQVSCKVLLVATLLGLALNGLVDAQSLTAGNGNQIVGNTVGNNNNNGVNTNNNNNNANGRADPILTDFEGKTFEFYGSGEGFYNLYSDAAHQVNMGLFPGFVDNHTGAYMEKFGIAFNKLRVLISLADQKGDMIVQSWNDERIANAALFTSGKPKSHVLTSSKDEALTIYTEPYRAFTGRTVNISTGIVEFSAWSVPAGTIDKFGAKQPAYLNFNITLLAPPAGGEVEGIIGESLNRMAVAQANEEKPEAISKDGEAKEHVASPIKASEESYAVKDIFGTDFAFNKFSPVQSNEPSTRRALAESHFGMLQFPVMGTSMD